jgi:hypothetical protein
MGLRGRESAASLTVLSGTFGQLPEPPESFQERQAEIWRDIVATKPVDWFQADSKPVLAGLCRAIALDEEIAAEIDAFDRTRVRDVEGFKLWKALLKMQREQQQHIASLATKLRLTPQSRYNAQKAATKSNAANVAARPWGNRVIPNVQGETLHGSKPIAESPKGD